MESWRSRKHEIVREPNTKICPRCRGIEMAKYYTDANDIILICRKCQYTELGDPKEREASLKIGISKHLEKLERIRDESK